MATNVTILRQKGHEYELKINFRDLCELGEIVVLSSISALDRMRFQKLPVYAFGLSKITNSKNTESIRCLRLICEFMTVFTKRHDAIKLKVDRFAPASLLRCSFLFENYQDTHLCCTK